MLADQPSIVPVKKSSVPFNSSGSPVAVTVDPETVIETALSALIYTDLSEVVLIVILYFLPSTRPVIVFATSVSAVAFTASFVPIA